jgi:hypothetical protein
LEGNEVAQLYAACRQNGPLVVRSVPLTNQLQGELDGIFQAQEAAFLAGIASEIAFTGDWRPNDDELLVIAGLPEAQTLLDAANQNAVALPVLDVGNFETEGVKGLFTAVGHGPNMRLLLQNFGPQQLLRTKNTFLHDGNVFRRLVEPAFSLGTQLVATIDASGRIKFKTYPMLRRFLDITPVFRQATDAELNTFCAHASLAVADVGAFVASADEGIRKHVLAIAKADVFNQHPVADIATQAAAIGFPLAVNAGRIEMPPDRKRTKSLLSFLLNKVYLGPIDQTLFITNSNRPLN